MTLEQALEVEADALAAEDLAEVATEAARTPKPRRSMMPSSRRSSPRTRSRPRSWPRWSRRPPTTLPGAAESDADVRREPRRRGIPDRGSSPKWSRKPPRMPSWGPWRMPRSRRPWPRRPSGPGAGRRVQEVSGRCPWSPPSVGRAAVAEPVAADTAALGKGHADWEQQFLIIAAHAAWEDEYSRMLGDTGSAPDVGAADAPAAASVEGAEPPDDDDWSIPRLVDDAPADGACCRRGVCRRGVCRRRVRGCRAAGRSSACRGLLVLRGPLGPPERPSRPCRIEPIGLGGADRGSHSRDCPRRFRVRSPRLHSRSPDRPSGIAGTTGLAGQLVERVVGVHLPVGHGSSIADGARILAPMVFVGRERELARLAGALQRAVAGRPSRVVLTAPGRHRCDATAG